jgi:hypothetical protein
VSRRGSMGASRAAPVNPLPSHFLAEATFKSTVVCNDNEERWERQHSLGTALFSDRSDRGLFYTVLASSFI